MRGKKAKLLRRAAERAVVAEVGTHGLVPKTEAVKNRVWWERSGEYDPDGVPLLKRTMIDGTVLRVDPLKRLLKHLKKLYKEGHRDEFSG